MAYFRCTTGGSGKGNTLVVTCADELAGATITCTNGTKTYTKTCPSTAPYEVTFYGLAAGTYTVSATVSGSTYTTTVVITDYEAELGGFSWKAWVNLSENYASSDFTDLDDLLSDETAIRELMTIHACVDYLAGIAATSADVEKIIENDYCAKWINNRDYALDTLYANTIIADYMDTADKYFYGEWVITDNTTTPSTWGPKGNIPVMTSATAPYGSAMTNSQSQSGYEYWKAFDGNRSTQGTVSNAVGVYIGYKFVNPVCVKKISYYNLSISSGEMKFQASNDNSTWIDLATLTDVTADVKINNSNYYLYYRIYQNTKTSSTTYSWVNELQIYGRELSVSVPTMTSNTAPYGIAFASSTYSDRSPYRVFDNNSATQWTSNENDYTNAYIGYTSTQPICVKEVHVKSFLFTSYADTIINAKIQGSNDNTNWTDIKDVSNLVVTSQSASVTTKIKITDNKNRYLHHRLKFVSKVSGSNPVSPTIGELQFYGLDYSEREFEEGSTKKWLYDHGVEVVAIDAMRDAGSKQSDCLNVAVGSSSANNTYGLTTPTDAIDLTPYSLIRAKVGKSMVGTIQPQASTQKTSYDSGRISYISIDQSHNKAMIPNDLTLDISSVNQNAYPNFIVGSTNMNTDIAEWWLE